MYKKAAELPNGLLCLNPEEPPGERIYFDANDPADALDALEKFVEYGTFAPVGLDRTWHLVLNLDFDELREAGQTYEDAVLELAHRYHHDTRTIERWLAKPMKPLILHKSSVRFD